MHGCLVTKLLIAANFNSMHITYFLFFKYPLTANLYMHIINRPSRSIIHCSLIFSDFYFYFNLHVLHHCSLTYPDQCLSHVINIQMSLSYLYYHAIATWKALQ
jgi:hypothetical protein